MDGNKTESLDSLNSRFAEALLPLTITFGIFTFIGFFGNLLILLVFSLSREYRKNNFKIFVLCLGIIDFITCLTLIPAEMVKQRSYFSFSDSTACKVKCFFNVYGASASCLALLVISIDRFRKVCQPLSKQLSPSLAVKLLLVLAFAFPIFLSIPGAVLCGIEKANKTNIYNGQTEIYLCATEDQYRFSVWRKIYKYVFIILLVGISCTYIVLYTFVMKAVVKQIQSMADHRKNSSVDVTYSTGIYDSGYPEKDESMRLSKENLDKTLSSESNQSEHMLSSADDSHPKFKGGRQFSTKSMRSNGPLIHRRQFPYKTMIWFILTIVFILTYITHLILALKVNDVVVMTTSEFSTWSFFYRIYFLNHMINPLVYAIFVKRFRKSCRTLLPNIRQRLQELFDS